MNLCCKLTKESEVEMTILGMPVNTLEIVGVIGGIVFISSYWLVSRGKVRAVGMIYNLMVFLSSIFYLIYGYMKKAPAVIILNMFVAGISIKGLYNCYKGYKARKNQKKSGN